MSYIVNQDIIDRVGTATAAQLTTDSGSTPSQTVLDEVRQSSLGEVDSYLSRRYATPVDLTAHPEIAATLKGFTLDVAEYRLRSRRQPVPDGVQAMYKSAVDWLTKVSKGSILLPADSAPDPSVADGPSIYHGSTPRIMDTDL